MKRLSFILPIFLILLQAAFWLRGRFHTDGIALILPNGDVQIAAIHHGGLIVAITQIPVRSPAHGGIELASMRSDFADDVLQRVKLTENSDAFGIAFKHDNGGMIYFYDDPAGDRRILYLPPWIFSAIAAAILLLPIVRLRRPRPGYCQTCGYDLRASADRCPECGTEIPESARIKSA